MMRNIAQHIPNRVRTRPWSTTGRALRLLESLDAETAPELEPQVLAAVRRLASAGRRRRSPLSRSLRSFGLVATEIDVAFAVLRHWRHLSTSGRQVVARSLSSELAAATQLWLDSDLDKIGEDVVEAMSECPPEVSVGAFERLLRHPNEAARAKAIERFGQIISRCGADHPCIDRALARMFDDGPELADRSVLLCVLPAVRRPGPVLAVHLADERHPTHLLLRSLVRNGPLQSDPRRLVALLAAPSVRPAALDAIERLSDPDRLGELVSLSHLLLAPERRHLLRDAKRLRTLMIKADLREDMRHAPRFLALTGAFHPEKRPQDLSPIIVRGGAATRANLAMRLSASHRPDEAVCKALCDLSFDPSPRIARRALLALSDDASAAMRDLVRRQTRSPHASCRSVAEDWLHQFDLGAALRTYHPLAGGVGIRRSLERNKDEALSVLRQSIQNGDADSRIAAMLWARRLGVAPACELELLAAVASEDWSVVATAVLALSQVRTDASKQAIAACVSHADARVCANAVEALGRRGDADELTLDLGDSEHARVRANVAHAFLSSRMTGPRRRDGIRILDHMVRDERPDHRRSALWLTERLARTESAQAVATMATRDSERAVRLRAKRTARRLLAEMRADILVRLDAPRHATHNRAPVA